MTRRLLVSEVGRTDRVTAVIIPMDGATRIPIRTGIDVHLWDTDRNQARPPRLIRNLSGHWVLLNESDDQDLTFRIVTHRASYRGPVFTTFNPKQQGRPDRVVALERRPDASFDDIATLVRGVVVGRDPLDTGQTMPQEDVQISASGAGLKGPSFPVTTDERGAFALIVYAKQPGADTTSPARTELRFEKKGLPHRALIVTLEHGRTHVFSHPVDLDKTEPIPFSHE